MLELIWAGKAAFLYVSEGQNIYKWYYHDRSEDMGRNTVSEVASNTN